MCMDAEEGIPCMEEDADKGKPCMQGFPAQATWQPRYWISSNMSMPVCPPFLPFPQGRDAEAATGFLDEIKLLNSLAGRSNIIQLIDSEVSQS